MHSYITPYMLAAGKEYALKEMKEGDFTTHANVGILSNTGHNACTV